MSVRLHKYLASCGVASRRKAEQLILDGRITVNGEIITTLGVKVDVDDVVTVDGKAVTPERFVVVAMNKPKGVVTTLSDPRRRPTIAQYLPDMGVTLKPVGRLDMDSDGLILATNDGELAARITHARYGLEKEYRVSVTGQPAEKDLDRLRRGIYVEGVKTSPAKIRTIGMDRKGSSTQLEFIIHEGRNRQIRRMCEAIGCPVITLKRVRIGPISLQRMPAGKCRVLGKIEIDLLKRAVGLP